MSLIQATIALWFTTGNGEFITQFGAPGINPGEFSEPVGVAVDSDGLVYVTDTWNQRIQVFAPDASGMVYDSILQIPGQRLVQPIGGK